jgi:hypothetical protein
MVCAYYTESLWQVDEIITLLHHLKVLVTCNERSSEDFRYERVSCRSPDLPFHLQLILLEEVATMKGSHDHEEGVTMREERP